MDEIIRGAIKYMVRHGGNIEIMEGLALALKTAPKSMAEEIVLAALSHLEEFQKSIGRKDPHRVWRYRRLYKESRRKKLKRTPGHP